MTEVNRSRKTKRRTIAIAVPAVLGWGCALMAIFYFQDYTFGLFIWLPAVLGMLSTLLYGFKNDVDRKEIRHVAFGTLAVFSAGLLTFAMEGIICIFMAAPIGLLFTYIGHWVGYAILKNSRRTNTPAVMLILALSVPALMAFEHSVRVEDDVRLITTSIEINAPVETVWNNVIHFSPIKEPPGFLFSSGIAYPVSAQIDGTGIGAIRHCNFSTGTFSEPITVWNEPTLLKFNVKEQPAPLNEISFYHIHPNHLHGYWVSQRGQFRLEKLANGHTRLEGTTWYINKIKPGLYWTIWSDYIVHHIHERVLEHIKLDSEN